MFIQMDKRWRREVITYKDIKIAYADLISNQEKRRKDLRASAKELIVEYNESLGLESDVWADIHGINHPYVSTGILDNDKFIDIPIYMMNMDGNYALNFSIKTVVNDSPISGDNVLTSISMEIQADYLVVDIGKGFAQFRIQMSSDKGNFFEATEAIKTLVIRTLTIESLM